MTLSLAAVFIPVLFMGGIVGRLFHEFAVTIGVAVLISGFVSLTLTPMLCSRFLRPPREEEHHAALQRLRALLRRHAQRVYELGLSAGRCATACTMVVGDRRSSPCSPWCCSCVMPKGFIPSEDIGQIFGHDRGRRGDLLRGHGRAPAGGGRRRCRADPNIEAFMSSAGGRGGFGASNTGLLLRPPQAPAPSVSSPPTRSSAGCGRSWPRSRGSRVFLQNPPAIRVGGRLTAEPVPVHAHGPDTEELYRAAPSPRGRAARDHRSLVDVTTDLQLKNPQVDVDIDRDQAAALGVTAQQIEDALYTAYGSRQISTIFAPNNQYRVIMELEPEFQRDSADLSLLYVRSDSGELVPLDALVRMSAGARAPVGQPLGAAPVGDPVVQPRARRAPGSGRRGGRSRLARETLPATITTSFQGTAQAFQSSMQGLGLLLLMAILVIYLVLGILYESFIHPLTILSALPLAGLGALVTLMLFGVDLNIYAFVGVIMLVGLVKKNGIIMIDFALEAQRDRRQDARRGHLRGLRGPLPAHHDDHHGGPLRHAAHRPGPRRRRRGAPAPGPGRGRRSARLPVADPVRHPGDLHLHGRVPGRGSAAGSGSWAVGNRELQARRKALVRDRLRSGRRGLGADKLPASESLVRGRA